MRFLVLDREFEAALERLGGVVLPRGPFSRDAVAESLESFRLLSFASIFRRDFFRAISGFSRGYGEEGFWLVVMEPDPVRYRRQFGRYNAIAFDNSDGVEDYIFAINDGPQGSSADSIMDGSNRLFFFSTAEKWLLVGDRATNLTYCCFADFAAKDKFEKLYSGDFFPDIAAAEEFSFETTGQLPILSSFGV